MNLIEIGLVVIDIREIENGELAVPINNTLVHHMAFFTTDTQPCVLMLLSPQYLGDKVSTSRLVMKQDS